MRRTYLLTGPAAATRARARTLAGATWVDASDARRHLGDEHPVVVYDAFAGFDPDAFGAIAGTVRGNGALVLLTPPPDTWDTWDDPQRARLAVHPYGPADVGARFLRRLRRTLGDATLVGPDDPLELPAPEPWSTEGTDDQRTAVDALLKVGRGRRRRPAVLVSDRGRGKSSALGIAAAELLAERPRTVFLTAPELRAVAPVFEHAARALGAVPHGGRLRHGDSTLLFLPPGELLGRLGEADVVFVDEAAALPVPLLERILEGHPRVAFATTVHGYEGTGRGFAVRFRATLDARAPGWREVRLTQPIRWASGDPLERLTFRSLLLDAEPAPDDAVADAAPESCVAERLDRDALAADEATLAELFGLLVLAHYRTSPGDLRRLLDAPNLSVYALRLDRHVVGTALVAAEGGFEPSLAEEVAAGRRRPHGHLLPETLAVHAGLAEAPALRAARVVRIAVHPAARSRGLGGALLARVVADAAANGLDYVGSAFGATPDLLRFWRRGGLEVARMGVHPGSASGARSAVVLRGLSPAGAALTEHARARLGRHLPRQLGDAWRDLDPALVLALLRGAPPPRVHLDEDDWRDVQAVAAGARPLEVCAGAVFDFVLGSLSAREPPEGWEVLVARVLQARPAAEVATRLGLDGRAGVDRALRAALRGGSGPAI